MEQVITSKTNGFGLALKFYLLPISNRKFSFIFLKVFIVLFSSLKNFQVPILLIGYENHKIEIYVRLHYETNSSEKVKNKFHKNELKINLKSINIIHLSFIVFTV